MTSRGATTRDVRLGRQVEASGADPDTAAPVLVPRRHPDPVVVGGLDHRPDAEATGVVGPTVDRGMTFLVPVARLDEHGLTDDFPVAVRMARTAKHRRVAGGSMTAGHSAARVGVADRRAVVGAAPGARIGDDRTRHTIGAAGAGAGLDMLLRSDDATARMKGAGAPKTGITPATCRPQRSPEPERATDRCGRRSGEHR